MPMIGRLVLALGVVAAAGGVLYVGAGGLGTVARSIGSTISGFVEDVTATPVPSVTPVPATDVPSIVAPAEPYTNAETVDRDKTLERVALKHIEIQSVRVRRRVL